MQLKLIIMRPKDVIGKYYEHFNIDGNIMFRFKILKARLETRKSIKHLDGSFSPEHTYLEVSENCSGWYGVYGTDRIVK